MLARFRLKRILKKKCRLFLRRQGTPVSFPAFRRLETLLTALNRKIDSGLESAGKDRVKTGPGGMGFWKREKGINVLRVRGTAQEMGYQHGFLLARQIQTPREGCHLPLNRFWSRYVDDLIHSFLKNTICKKLLFRLAKRFFAPFQGEIIMVDRISDEGFLSLVGLYGGYRRRMAGWADSGEMPSPGEKLLEFHELVRGYTQPDVLNIFLENTLGGGSRLARMVLRDVGRTWEDEPVGGPGCTSLGILSDLTEDRDLLLGCNFDYEPLAGLWENNLTLIYFDPLPEPSGRVPQLSPVPFVTLTTAGSHTGGLMGVNEKGIVFRVHNHFTRLTDNDFTIRKRAHGIPLLNFGDHILKYGRQLQDEGDLDRIFGGIRAGITLTARRGEIREGPPSGWSFILGQADGRQDRIFVREMDFQCSSTTAVPVRYQPEVEKLRRRFALIGDLAGETDAMIRTIWQSNFYTDPHLHRHDMFIRRSNQLSKLNRYFRVGLRVREIIGEGESFNWEKVASILADNRNIFTRNRERLNVGGIASMANVTSIIFSVRPRPGKDPAVRLYLGYPRDPKSGRPPENPKPPTAWWPYGRVEFETFRDGGIPARVIRATGIRYRPRNYHAQKILASVFEQMTFQDTGGDDYREFVIFKDRLLGELKDVEQSLQGVSRVDPFIYFLQGKLNAYCARRLQSLGRDRAEILPYLSEAARRFRVCMEKQTAEDRYLYDPHLLTLARLGYLNIGLLADYPVPLADFSQIKTKLLSEDLRFEDLLWDPPVLKEALQPFISGLPDGPGGHLQYRRSSRLQRAVAELCRDPRLKLRHLDGRIKFDGPDPQVYRF